MESSYDDTAMLTRKRQGAVTGDELIAWRKRLKFNRKQAAEQLGCTRHSIQDWETGARPIRRYIALACAALSHGIPPLGAPPLVDETDDPE